MSGSRRVFTAWFGCRENVAPMRPSEGAEGSTARLRVRPEAVAEPTMITRTVVTMTLEALA